jgi:hypothetical protein
MVSRHQTLPSASHGRWEQLAFWVLGVSVWLAFLAWLNSSPVATQKYLAPNGETVAVVIEWGWPWTFETHLGYRVPTKWFTLSPGISNRLAFSGNVSVGVLLTLIITWFCVSCTNATARLLDRSKS